MNIQKYLCSDDFVKIKPMGDFAQKKIKCLENYGNLTFIEFFVFKSFPANYSFFLTLDKNY